MRIALATLFLLAACEQNVHYTTAAPVTSVESVQPSVTGGKTYTHNRRLQLGYDAAQRWVRISPEARRAVAASEASFLREQAVKSIYQNCLSPEFLSALTEKLTGELHDPALFNALAVQWSGAYDDAQLAEIHRVATSGGSPADLNPALFPPTSNGVSTAPTAASINSAATLAAMRVFAEQPATYLAYVRQWIAQHPQPCRAPATEAQWQLVLDNTAIYTRSMLWW